MPNSTLRTHLHIHVLGSSLGRCLKWGLLAIGLTIFVTQAAKASAAQARAEYIVSIGDILDVQVAGVPELRYRTPVQIDGSIALPLVGMLPVAGLTLPQIQAKVGAALARKQFRQTAPDGHENIIVIDANEVTTTIAEYRPIYINGDVSKPGEYPYRPGTTARQLIAVAGGYDIMHMRMNNPYLESVDLRSQYASLWTEFAKGQADLWRIKSELGDGSQISPTILNDVPVAPSTISDIVNAEKEYLKTRQSDYQNQKEFLQRGIRDAAAQVGVLADQQKQEEAGYQEDVADLQKVNSLFSRGALISPRVEEARRAVLVSATRKLQTNAQLLLVKRQQEELTRKLEQLSDQRKLGLLRELQDTSLKLTEIRQNLQGVGEKLQYSAMVRSQLQRGAGHKPKITIVRKGEKGQQRIDAGGDTELQPGDTVEVALRYQDGPKVPAD